MLKYKSFPSSHVSKIKNETVFMSWGVLHSNLVINFPTNSSGYFARMRKNDLLNL